MTNEQIRLFASYLNIAGAAALVAALITEPFSSVLTTRSLAMWPFVLMSFVMSIFFHTFAQLTLRKVKENER